MFFEEEEEPVMREKRAQMTVESIQ